jgi:hypothetical protein
VFEQGSSSRKVLMIDLSLYLDEENFIADTSHDAEFTKKLFGDLNRAILRPPGDGKVIILDDFDEKKGGARGEDYRHRVRGYFCCYQPGLNRLRRRRRCSCGGKK